MATRTPAQQAANIADPPQTFFVKKKTVPEMLAAIRGKPNVPPSQTNPYGQQGYPGLQDRTDLSGKFARKVGQNRRALERADEAIQEERLELIKRHAKKDANGDFAPVYQTINTAEGPKPIFRKDAAGNDTDDRVRLPDAYDIADENMVAFQHDVKEMLEEIVVVVCPGFTEDDWNKFQSNPNERSPIGKIIDPLIDLERDGPTTKDPSLEDLSAFDGDEDRGRRVLSLDKNEPEPTAP